MSLIYMECTLQYMFNTGQPELANTIMETYEHCVTDKLSYAKIANVNEQAV